MKNNLDIVKLLLDYGADEKIKNNQNNIPIQCTNKNEIIEYINNYTISKFVLK